LTLGRGGQGAAPLAWLVVGVFAGACGPAVGAPPSTPGADTPEAERGRLRGTVAADPERLAESDWRYVEGTCTEGILDMSVRGFTETLRVHALPGGAVIVADRHFAEDECTQTVRLGAQRGPADSPDTRWAFSEHARVSYPASPRCEQVPQEDAAGDVRMRGSRLELFLRRSPWCGGYEARLVYEATPARTQRDDATTLRHFIAAFHDRDSLALAELYAASGAHDDPHRPDEASRPTRHEGRTAVQAYFAGVFHQVPWLAFRLLDVQPAQPLAGQERGVRLRARVEYMDARLEAPRLGVLQLDLVDSRVFASRLELVEQEPGPAVPGLDANAR
jgi:hypothetical protein